LYIIAGGYGSGGIGESGEVSKKIVENINVPAHCWKIVVVLPEGSNDLQRINDATRIIAVDMPNNQVVNKPSAVAQPVPQNNKSTEPKVRLEINAKELAEIRELLAKRNKNYKVV
jgi:endonuclease G